MVRLQPQTIKQKAKITVMNTRIPSSCALLKNQFNTPDLLCCLPIADAVTAAYDAYVTLSESGIGLLIPTLAKKPYCVDFCSEQMAYRSEKSMQQNELIVRACRIKLLERPCTVVDATAGFGRDAFILASSGFEVCLIERHPVIAALLEQGIARIAASEIKSRLSLRHEDSQTYLKYLITAKHKPDIIYLDPMFAIKRHAKVKKELQTLQILLRDVDDDSHTLLPLALQAAAKRVVVKRAIDAPLLNDLKPSFVFSGKQARFDVYAHRPADAGQ